ncbi:MAG TPA: FMN-binding protein [Candidatus Limnocylindrales bacterium]
MPKRGAVALVTTILAVVLLLTFKTGDQSTLRHGLPTDGFIGAPPAATAAPIAVVGGPTPGTTATTPPTSVRSGPTAAPGRAAGPPAPAATPQPSTAAPVGQNTSGTFTGQAIDTPYGTVQIALVVQSGKIIDVQELQLPSDRRLSQQISAQAGPMLRTQVLQAQSDQINGVSGASYTSYGFYQSLQSALSQMQ